MSVARLAIIGISGRMGVEIASLAPELGFRVTSGIAKTAKKNVDLQIVKEMNQLNAEDIDLVIDFSLPGLTDEVISWCEKNKKPLVSGVTGLNEANQRALRRATSTIPILWSPNMSLGIAVLTRALSQLKHLKGFDFQIEETHHIRKKDAPSGTALALQSALQTAVGGNIPKPLSIRGGGVFGNHRVMALGEEETLTFEHSALNRRVFARGALRAAAWLVMQKPALYRLDDVL